MFINNWYAACIADELTDTPQRVTMLGCDFVLFRDGAGVARCLSDSCCHRGASLAGGVCRDGLIVCPQHGWEYNGQGKCKLIPAGTRTPTEPPKKARVPSYPTEEKYGMVFAFLGDMSEDERPTIPDRVPEYETGDWHWGIIKRKKDINYVRMSENYNDPCHVHYVHEFAKWLPKGVTIIDHDKTDTYVKAFHAAWDAKGHHSEDVGLMMEFDVIGMMSRNTNNQPNYPTQIVLATTTPIDESNTQIFMQLLQPKDGKDSKEQHKMLMEMTEHQVMDEDYAVLKTTRPRQAANPTEELLVETDVTLAQVRKITKEYGEKSGQIDVRALAELRDTHIRVIPCPEHRSDPKGWVHKTVPLLEKTAARGKLHAAS
jgi:phenylpropionate dioxygenase-like ring-hydroxylating dioxygenase large terminal subunit